MSIPSFVFPHLPNCHWVIANAFKNIAMRCEFAEKLLVSTDRTVSEIALEVGFASTKYLISHFKKWYGCTPYEAFLAEIMRFLKIPPQKEAQKEN